MANRFRRLNSLTEGSRQHHDISHIFFTEVDDVAY